MKTSQLFACSLLAGMGLVLNLAHAVELKVLSGNGSRPAVIALTKQFEQATGHKVTVDFFVNPDVKKKIEAGEYFDVTVLNPPVLDELIKTGKVAADSRAVIGRIGLGAAIKAGAPKPDISTPEGFKKTMLSINSDAYPGVWRQRNLFRQFTRSHGHWCRNEAQIATHARRVQR